MGNESESSEVQSSELGSSAVERAALEAMEVEICSLAGQIAAATARFLQVLAKFDELGGWAGPGIHSCAHWLSWKCGMSLHTGREHVRVARALKPLPVVRSAFEKGRVSYSKVRSLTRVATPENEQRLVDIALTAPAAHLDRLVAGMKKVTSEPAPKESRFVVRWRWDVATGDFVLSGRLSAQDGALLLAGLERAERERNRTIADGADNEVPRPLGDVGPAMVAMAEIANGAESPVVGRPSEVIFLHEDGATRVHQGPALEDAGAAETLCDTQVRRGKTRKGAVLDFGRTRRITTPKQMLALITRDKCCRTPDAGERGSCMPITSSSGVPAGRRIWTT
ncbi:DUF222 domain-containing protein [Antrihabitans cavernicola]|uniref:DUF222 domain-containing protein n=1 Tax=Antrihabitans cavernicola TaxID=2495913 RepID=A0A5A7S8A8_9NOCA|nr:DUF222 domain-containing protein [Spelaeibacter cavernicola]KAA0021714.1 DUF222 domain-containing protein [Spelaeibacter cavernicola]